jgi:endonuclease/exonuclease/phosphatase (EEP) superfamily protein YafD
MGIYDLAEMNENGKMFSNFCASHDLVTGGTIFPHKKCHKVTWVSPDHATVNQLDHIAIDKKFRTSLTDVRNKRGVDTGSDHHLVLAEFKLRTVDAGKKFESRRKKV